MKQMMRGFILWAVVALVVLLPPGDAHASLGDHLSSSDFATSTYGLGIAFDGSHFYVYSSNNSAGPGAISAGIYKYTQAGAQVSFNSLPIYQYYTRGITWGAAALYVLDSNSLHRVNFSSNSATTPLIFALDSENDHPAGVSWDGTYFRIPDYSDDKVYTYLPDGTHVSSKDFDLVADNANPKSIAWAGDYRILDSSDDKIYTYDTEGNHIPAQDFNLTGANANPNGIVYDGDLRVTDSTDDKVYTYDLPPTTTYGLTTTAEAYAGAISSTITEPNGWKCVQSTAGVVVRVNNAETRVHGFCVAEASGTDGMAVEIHLAPTATHSDLVRFAETTGQWWFIETGSPATLNQRIYNDRSTDTVGLAFTEEVGNGLQDSTRLGFATTAKSVTSNDCMEDVDTTEGFDCSRSFFDNLVAGDSAVLLFSLAEGKAIEDAGTPSAPDSLKVSVSSDYTEATVTWEEFDVVVEYQLERLVAVTVSVGDATRIEYGDPVTFLITGTQAGVDSYTDATLEAHRTYQYRIRARGASVSSWSAWSDFVFYGGQGEVDIPSPSNVALSRDEDSVIISWEAPSGDFDNYTVQRQELVVVEGSTFFANISTLAAAGESWLPTTSTMYDDESILPAQTYEYRVAAVRSDQVGAYSDWFRISPLVTVLGAAPPEFHFISESDTILSGRREFWMAWEPSPGADDYEVQKLVYDVATFGQSMEKAIITDPTYFVTSYGTVDIRVRGRKLDADLCAAASDNRCLTGWTGWWTIPFTPQIVIEAPTLVDDAADTSIMELREDTIELIESMFEPSGATVNGSVVLAFMVVVIGLIVGSLNVALAWRRGMASLGVGMGCAILILILFTGYRLYGTPIAWPVAVQSVVAVTGLYAIVRQVGVFK